MWPVIHTKCTTREDERLTQTSTSTVVEWWVNYRIVCTGVLEAEPKFVGTLENPVQVDETYMSGRRKYQRGRMLHGDRNNQTADTNDNYESDEIPDWGEETADENEDRNKDEPEWNWVVGIYRS